MSFASVESNEYFRPVTPPPKNIASQLDKPGPLLILGAPGVGKGTQAGILAAIWGIPKISTGDILRANVANATALGVQANRIMRDGGLVPDAIVTEMVAHRLMLPDTASGFILDGFPRTIGQAQWLDAHLCSRPSGGFLGVIGLQMDYQRIVDRITHRRFCPNCRTVYNTLLMPPKQLDRCDKDNSSLEQRDDDRFEVFQVRLNVFRRETESLFNFYRKRALVIEVDADRSPSQVTRDVVSRLMDFRTALTGITLDRLVSPFSRSGEFRSVDACAGILETE